jgi:hypothetical protein
MRVILQFIIFILACFISKSNAQEAGLPTASEIASVKKNFPILFQSIATNFEKLKKGKATDYFGQQLFESSIRLLPENIGPLPQRIYFITEEDGKRVNTYNEELPFSAEVCIEMLSPLLKQNGLIEVVPVRADSNMVTKSFKGKNGVVIFSVNPFTQGTIITIGKPYYYYENESKSIANKSTLQASNNSATKAQNNTEANKKEEERMVKALTKLFKSATNTSGSFRELKIGQPEKVNEVNIYDIKGQLQLDSLQSAFLLETEISNNINGVSIDITGGTTANYIAALHKMAKSAETAGEVNTERKTGVTRYSLISKSQKQEIIYLLDFDYPEYNDRLICTAIYTSSEPAVKGNK